MNQIKWAEFCDRLKAAGELINHESAPHDPLNQSEGYRYLTRLLRAGLESAVEGSDPRFPTFYSLSHDTIKIGNDNPDNYYLNCCINGEYQYLIEGQTGEVEYFSIATKAGSYATTGDMRPTGELTSEHIKIASDGSFQVWVSTTAPTSAQRKETPNWLTMTPDSDNLIVRQYCNARQEAPAQFKIHCVNPGTAPMFEPDLFAEKLLRAAAFVEGTSGLFNQWIDQFKSHTNRLPANDQEMCLRVGGNERIHYHNSHWQLASDEALLIKPERIPECEAWNFQVSNYWMESLDYRYYPITLNNTTAALSEDGSVTLVVAHQDPGRKFPNWLTTAGHNQGSMLFRWIDAKEFPPIHTKLVKFADL